MRILGIDPGSHRVGWGVIERDGNHTSYVDSGVIELPPHTQETVYLQKLYADFTELLLRHHPDLIAIEKLFFSKNITTGMTVAESRGVIMLAVASSAIPYVQYSPNTIKSAVAGNGSAGKAEVVSMVGRLLHCDTSHMLDDTCDALAIALTASPISYNKGHRPDELLT